MWSWARAPRWVLPSTVTDPRLPEPRQAAASSAHAQALCCQATWLAALPSPHSFPKPSIAQKPHRRGRPRGGYGDARACERGGAWQLWGSSPCPCGLAPGASALDHSAKLSYMLCMACAITRSHKRFPDSQEPANLFRIASLLTESDPRKESARGPSTSLGHPPRPPHLPRLPGLRDKGAGTACAGKNNHTSRSVRAILAQGPC